MQDLEKSMKNLGIKAKLKTIDKYYKNEKYNQAIVERIKESLGNADASEYELVFSAHGLPQRIIDKGDLY